ncbi:MAG: hypothetical protein BGO12_23145 [Verrucomicrobia bacterium 61-8]|nr:MAG: hypothetical protein BGO12_23145 [Verrucomicrobia bacterium 61-8]
MASPNRIFALNLGMQTVTLAEFHTNPAGGITLHACQQEELIVDPAADLTRPAQVEAAVSNLRKAMGISAKEKLHFALPSQAVFTRFVKLPGGSPDDVESIIGFEAQQNVPFPIDEVVWDHQIMGASKDNNWNVVLVAIKADQLGDINTSVNQGGFRSATIDVAPMALYNAFRYNYSELTGCSLLVDIGARTTNLIFIEGDRVFSRSIPVGGNTISAAVAKEFKQDVTVGEKLKLEKGFVGLGGAYAEPEDPTEMRISKIVRNTMTRLHADIARSISFYRQNQGGSAPVRTFLCGGTVGLPYMVEFFSEKLQTPIEYFNPLRNVTVNSQAVADFASTRAHALGELVGCALRAIGNCPVEITLRPQTVVREQDLARRKPFLVLASLCIIASLGAWWYFVNRSADIMQGQLDSVNEEVTRLEQVANQFTAVDAENKTLQETATPLILTVAERSTWANIIDELATRLPAYNIWVTNLQPLSQGKPYSFAGGKTGSATPAATPSAGGNRPPGEAGPPKIDALQVNGLFLANPPDRLDAPKVIDEFVDQLRKSPAFNLEVIKNAEIVPQRTTPDGRSWAYPYTIILPLRNPIALP